MNQDQLPHSEARLIEDEPQPNSTNRLQHVIIQDMRDGSLVYHLRWSNFPDIHVETAFEPTDATKMPTPEELDAVHASLRDAFAAAGIPYPDSSQPKPVSLIQPAS